LVFFLCVNESIISLKLSGLPPGVIFVVVTW
jgi:hypothetical protein